MVLVLKYILQIPLIPTQQLEKGMNLRLVLLRITCQELLSLLYSVIVFLALYGRIDGLQGRFR